MKYLTETLVSLIFIIAWVVGVVLASGFWSTLFSVFFPPWGWYLIAEWVLHGCPAIP